jgi:hypothetical protein
MKCHLTQLMSFASRVKILNIWDQSLLIVKLHVFENWLLKWYRTSDLYHVSSAVWHTPASLLIRNQHVSGKLIPDAKYLRAWTASQHEGKGKFKGKVGATCFMRYRSPRPPPFPVPRLTGRLNASVTDNQRLRHDKSHLPPMETRACPWVTQTLGAVFVLVTIETLQYFDSCTGLQTSQTCIDSRLGLEQRRNTVVPNVGCKVTWS